MKKKRLLAAVLLLALLCSSTALAAGFSKDAAAINAACRSVLKLEAYDGDGKLIKSASGFAAFETDCLVSTCALLVGAAKISATDDGGQSYEVSAVVCFDEALDVAILRLSGAELEPLKLSDGAQILRGAPVVAIGSPKGLTNNVSTGNISSVGKGDGGTSLIRFNAPVSGGTGGGALLNDDGLVIGFIRGDASESGSQNSNAALDIAHVIGLYEAHKDDGDIELSGFKGGSDTKKSAAPHKFKLKNSAPFAISEVYLYPDGAASWGKARNTKGWLQRDASLTIQLNDEELSARSGWSLNFCFRFKDRPYYYEYKGLKLSEILGHTLVITMDESKRIEITVE